MIITQYGKDAIAAAAAGQTKISFTNLKTSDTGTLTTDTYPDFQSIKQSISPSSITMDSQTDTAKVAGLFNNNNLGMAYQIKAVGLYATCAGAFAMPTPRLFAYELFGTPDFMPLPSEAPTSYTYAFNTTINDAATVEVVIQPGDYALASDLQDVQGRLSDFALADDVPEKTSELTNDGNGTSPYATQAYVGANGGKIDTIKVNGTARPIVSKAVDIPVPTKTSQLNNDSTFQTKAQVDAAVASVDGKTQYINFKLSDARSLVEWLKSKPRHREYVLWDMEDLNICTCLMTINPEECFGILQQAIFDDDGNRTTKVSTLSWYRNDQERQIYRWQPL